MLLVANISAPAAAPPHLPLAGGFFDGKTSAEERQRFLLETIRTASSASGRRGGGSDDCERSDAQLNQLLARAPGEAEALAAEDRRMQAAELASWRALLKEAAGGEGGGAGLEGDAGFSRLATEAEVGELVRLAMERLQPKVDPDAGWS